MSKYHAFDLPEDLVASLTPFALENGEQVSGSSIEAEAPQPSSSLTPSTDPAPAVSNKSFEQELEKGNKIECSYCGALELGSAAELRNHYKLDYHRFNIKRRLRNLPPVSEQEFETLADELENESLSGSEDEESDSDELEGMMQKTTLNTVNEDDEQAKPKVGSPFLLFDTDKVDRNRVLGLYKTLVNPELFETPLKALESLDKSGQSAIFMLGGGHFSGAVIQHAPDAKNKPTHQNPYAHIKITHHKGFHRYTTRRKQGGSQAANDNAGGKANSAGSTLRRYNEQALQHEIRELLSSWRQELAKCDHIYIRANGKNNRAILMNYEGDKSPISGKDPRVKNIPFPTRRATTSEIKRAWLELVTVRPVEKPVPASSKSKPATKPQPKETSQQPQQPTKPELTENEKHTIELTQLVKKSRSPRIVAYLKTHRLTPEFELQPEQQYQATPTLLFYAAAQNSPHVVQMLLTQLRADPTVTNSQGKVPFELCHDRATRDAFQLARGTLGEEAWDWRNSKVPHALTKRQIEQRDVNERAQLDQQRQQEMAKQEERAKQDKLNKTEQKHGLGKKLASSVQTNVSSDAGLRGLSDEARMRLERERRARAAEARFKKQ